jgi:hypothetical protein
MLTKDSNGQLIVQKDWGPSLIGSAYSRPGPMNCRLISWDMERLQTSLLLRHKAQFRDRIVKYFRFGRV